MREIKFRAWDGRKILSVERTELEISLRGLKQNDDFILLQFTGLHDKNGKEVWEGDVIHNGKFYGNGEIKFDWGRFYCTVGMEWGEIETGCEVIGNVYENPELLPIRKPLKDGQKS